MSSAPIPNQSYFSGLTYNPAFYTSSDAVSLDYVNQNFLSRINTTTSTAPTTLFSNSITTNGITNTGTLTTDNSIVNNIIISNGLNSYTVSGYIVNANTLSGNFIYESNQLLSNKYLNKLTGGSISGLLYTNNIINTNGFISSPTLSGFVIYENNQLLTNKYFSKFGGSVSGSIYTNNIVITTSGLSVSGNIYSDNIYNKYIYTSPNLDCISGFISEVGTSAGTDLTNSNQAGSNLIYSFVIPPYYNKTLIFTTPMNLYYTSIIGQTITMSLNTLSCTIYKNSVPYYSPTIILNNNSGALPISKQYIASGFTGTSWSVNQYFTNGLFLFTPPYENATNSYDIYYNYSCSQVFFILIQVYQREVQF